MEEDGLTCLKVLYDYDYVANDGRGVSIQKGEELLLIRKTNDDWWQVIRDGETKPFFAPMNYLTVLQTDELNGQNVPEIRPNNVNDNNRVPKPSDMVLFISNPLYSCVSDMKIDKNSNPNANDSKLKSNENINEQNSHGVTVIHIAGPSTPSSKIPEDEGNHSDDSKTIDSIDDDNEYDGEEEESNDDDGTKSTDSAYNERLQKVVEEEDINLNISEAHSDDNLNVESENPIYANFPLHTSLTPPKPSPNESPIKVLFNYWGEYLDSSGRKFYFNSQSGETTWKPPRRMPDAFGDEEHVNSQDTIVPDKESIDKPLPPTPPKKPKPKLVKSKKSHKKDNSYDYNTASSNDSLDQFVTPPLRRSPSPNIPKGWMKQRDCQNGDIHFINELSKEKWLQSFDRDNERVYYYAENSNDSFWELPEISQEPAKKNVSSIEPCREAPQPPGALAVAPPQVPRHLTRAPPLPSSLADRKLKTHSVMEPSWRPPPPKSEKGGKSASLPRGLEPPTEDPPKKWPELRDGCMVITRQGTLNKTSLLEAGKRLKKNWSQVHVTLTNLYLLFYKDMKSAQQINGGCKPEITIDLGGASIDWCPDVSRRKNVFQITTVLNNQILLQDDNAQTSKEWFNAIQSVIMKLPSTTSLTLATASSPKEKTKKGSRLSRSKSTKQKIREGSIKTSDSSSSITSTSVASSPTDELACNSPTERKKRIRDKLRNFFLRRPSMESLREKGIIKDEPVFGCNLSNLCAREKTTFPKFVQACIEAIEKKDMSADGLYRASGNLSQVQKIRFQVNQDDYSGLKTEEDVHVLTGALKMFFRDMKEPLFPFNMYHKFIEGMAQNDRHQKLASITKLIRSLPEPNGDTLKFLLKHLVRVTQLCDKNRMHVQNVAIVFGPTLLWPLEESSDLAVDMMHQNQIMELLLLEFNHIYSR